MENSLIIGIGKFRKQNAGFRRQNSEGGKKMRVIRDGECGA
jgi:hypothetical protein